MTATPPKSEPTLHYPIYIAAYAYDSRTDNDLTFKKGDFMYIIDTDEGDWWWARLKDSGRCGYIPSYYVTKYKRLEDEV